MSTITQDEQTKIADWLEAHPILAVGVGTKAEACSIAAINLAMTGELTDRIPGCMSPVVGAWIIAIQDRMPATIRNSDEWRRLLPLAAGTGRELEEERRAMILDWMWTRVLPSVQPTAERLGFAAAWTTMLTDRTPAAAEAAWAAAAEEAAAEEAAAEAWAAAAWARAAEAAWARAAEAAWAAAAEEAAWAAAAEEAARAAAEAAWAAAAEEAARAAEEAAWAAAAEEAARAAAAAAAAAAEARAAEARAAEAWAAFDPCALLAELVAVGEPSV